jgi:hypothetical protein
LFRHLLPAYCPPVEQQTEERKTDESEMAVELEEEKKPEAPKVYKTRKSKK